MGNITPGPRILPAGGVFPAGGAGNAYHIIYVATASLTFAESYDGAAQTSYATWDRDSQQMTTTYTGVFSNTAQSTSTLTGGLQTRGGLGVVKDAFLGGALNVAGVITGDGSGLSNIPGPTYGAGVATFLATPTSANLAAAVTDELGSGSLIFSPGTLSVTAGKSLSSTNTLTLRSTDGSTLDVGTGGTLGTGAYATAFDPAAPDAIGGTTPAAGSFTTLAASGAVTFTGGTLTGGAGNFTFTAGTGNSRTLAFQTTTSGGVATTALTLGADQSATFAAGATFNGNVGLPSGTGTLTAGVLTANGTGGVKIISGSLGCNIWPASGDTLEIVNRAEGGDGNLQCLNLRPFGDVVCGTAGKGLQLKSGTGARAGNAVLVGGTVTVTNTTVTANSIIYCGRKTAGGTLGQSLSYTLSAGASFTITSVDATGVLSALDTSTVSFIIVELN